MVLQNHMIFKNYIDVEEIHFQQIRILQAILYLIMQFLQYDDVDSLPPSLGWMYHFILTLFIIKCDRIRTYLITLNEIKVPNGNYFYPTFCKSYFWWRGSKVECIIVHCNHFCKQKDVYLPHQLGISNYHTLSSFVYTFICIEMYCSQLSLVMVQYADNLKHFSSLFVLRFLDIQWEKLLPFYLTDCTSRCLMNCRIQFSHHVWHIP